MSAPILRQYRPLNGEEIIDYACRKLREAMINSGQFPLHRVFHEMRLVGGVRVSGWGSRDAEAKFQCEFSAEPEAPDLVRERLAQPVQEITIEESYFTSDPAGELLAGAKQLADTVEKMTQGAGNCPDCDKFIDSEAGMRIHRARWCKEKQNESGGSDSGG